MSQVLNPMWISTSVRNLYIILCRAFSPQEAAEFRLPVEQKMTAGGYAYVLNNLRFENGYLLKNMSLSSIRLEEGNPSIEEITRYNQVGTPGIKC